MKIASGFDNYRLIATGDGYKLESFGDVTLLRPDPQVIWPAPFKMSSYKGLNAVYHRNSDGGGYWEKLKPVPQEFSISWNKSLKFSLKLMGFKHTGVFPEQAVNWERIISTVKNNGGAKVLNLFGYTGGASLAVLRGGGQVTHVDSAKAMCERAGKNIEISGLPKNCRFIVEDCIKFVEREIRRGNKYDAVIMDPPSFGRGAGGETWKLEEKIYSLVELTRKIVSDEPLFYLINSYTTGLQPGAMRNVLIKAFGSDAFSYVDSDEIGIPGEDGMTLPCGASCFALFKKRDI